MNYQIFKPSEKLKNFIHFYWIFEHDKLSEQCSEFQRIVPSGFVEINFHYGAILKEIKNGKSQNQAHSVISGQKTEFFDILQTGKTGFVSVLFKPHAARLFFDLPVNELTNLNIDYEYLLKNEPALIIEQLSETDDNLKKIDLIEKFLLKRLNNNHFYNFKRLDECLKTINQKKGILKVKEIAESACLSEKQLNRIFAEFVGISPKQFLKIVRLQYAFYIMQHKKASNLTELSYLCGYFDQAHFNNDFKSLTGFLPKNCFNSNEIFSDYFSKF